MLLLVGSLYVAVIYVRVLQMELQVLREEVIQTALYLINRTTPFFLVAISLVTGLSVELTLDEGHNAEYIPTISLVAILVVNLANVVAWRGSTPTLAVDIFCTESPLVEVVLSRETVTVLLDAAGLTCQWVEHVTTATSPSESTDADALDRHHPDTADEVLAVIFILHVDTFTIVDTYLIVEYPATVGIGEEITRDLDTDITTT